MSFARGAGYVSLRAGLFLVLVLVLAGCIIFKQTSPLPEPPAPSVVYLPQIYRGYKTPMDYGVGGAPFTIDIDWYYGWSVGAPVVGERFVRMIWCLNDAYLTVNLPLIIAAAKADTLRDRHTWLVLNEPDFSGTPDSCGYYLTLTPEQTADRYAEVYTLIKSHDPQAFVYVGGIAGLSSAGSRSWWTRFVSRLSATGKLYTVNGVHIHAYPCWSAPCGSEWGMPELIAALDHWYQNYHVGLGLGNRPVWITEVGAGPLCQRFEPFDAAGWVAIRDNVMIPFKVWYESDANPGYDSAAWFVSWWGGGLTWWCGFLVDARLLPTTLTPLGLEWGK